MAFSFFELCKPFCQWQSWDPRRGKNTHNPSLTIGHIIIRHHYPHMPSNWNNDYPPMWLTFSKSRRAWVCTWRGLSNVLKECPKGTLSPLLQVCDCTGGPRSLVSLRKAASETEQQKILSNSGTMIIPTFMFQQNLVSAKYEPILGHTEAVHVK